MDSNTINNKTQTRIPPPRGYALSGKIMLSAIVVLFSIVLIILFVHLYVRWRVYRRRSLRGRRNPLIFAGAGDPSPPSPAISRGLDAAVIESLHVSLFSAEDLEEDDVAECSVCINEFEEGNKVRVLPRCGHRFHIACIDEWFGSHNSCPLCRSAVEVEESAESPAAVARGQRCDPSTGSSSENLEVRIEIGRREEEVRLGLGFGRILGIKKFLFWDLRMNSGEGDTERGEAVGGAPAAVAASVV